MEFYLGVFDETNPPVFSTAREKKHTNGGPQRDRGRALLALGIIIGKRENLHTYQIECDGKSL